MSAMFQQVFAAIAMFFAAFEKFASAANNIATVADESSAAYADESRIQRKMKLNQLNRDLEASAKATTVTEPIPPLPKL